MSGEDFLRIFEEKEAILRGHFLLSSGLHSDIYVQCALVLQEPELAGKLCGTLAGRFREKEINLVVGPALGGIIVSFEVARYLGVRSIFTERVEGRMCLRRGFRIEKGERVLLVEDVITTGKSLSEVKDVVEEWGGKIEGVGCLVNRSGGVRLFGKKIESLLSIPLKNYSPPECPLCRKNIPLTKPGSRHLSR